MGVELDLNNALDQAIKLYKSKKITLHQKDAIWPYATLEEDPNGESIKYCGICFGYEGKLIPLFNEQCLICQQRGMK